MVNSARASFRRFQSMYGEAEKSPIRWLKLPERMIQQLTQITSADGAILAVRSHSIGETVQVTVMRGNDQKTFDVTLGSDEELQRQQEEANSQPVSDINSYTNGNGNGSGQDNSQLLQQFQQWLQQQQEGYGYNQR